MFFSNSSHIDRSPGFLRYAGRLGRILSSLPEYFSYTDPSDLI